MPDLFVLAHMSDPHLPPLPMPGLRDWNVKRALGVINWHRRRKRQHLPDTVDRLVADMLAQGPSHIAVTGDLANIGLPVELQAATEWLRTVGPPDKVSVVPGNHDIYVPLGSDPGVGRWQAYMSGDGDVAAGATPAFPYVRHLGPIALIGLNSAVPTPPLYASGRLGKVQLEALAQHLDALGRAHQVRVVLIHHPPVPGLREARCALEDAEALAAVLRAHGAELVLHGHNHRAMLTFIDGPRRPIPIVGVPSASLGRAHGRQTLARYNLYRISPDPAEPIAIVERGLFDPNGSIEEVGRRLLTKDAAAHA